MKKNSSTALDRQIKDYLVACQVEGKSERTVQAYRETLKQFRLICNEEGLPGNANDFRPAHIYRYLDRVRLRGVSIGTRHRRYRETRTFFAWCVRAAEFDQNPLDGIPNVRIDQKVIRPFTEEGGQDPSCSMRHQQ